MSSKSLTLAEHLQGGLMSAGVYKKLNRMAQHASLVPSMGMPMGGITSGGLMVGGLTSGGSMYGCGKKRVLSMDPKNVKARERRAMKKGGLMVGGLLVGGARKPLTAEQKKLKNAKARLARAELDNMAHEKLQELANAELYAYRDDPFTPASSIPIFKSDYEFNEMVANKYKDKKLPTYISHRFSIKKPKKIDVVQVEEGIYPDLASMFERPLKGSQEAKDKMAMVRASKAKAKNTYETAEDEANRKANRKAFDELNMLKALRQAERSQKKDQKKNK